VAWGNFKNSNMPHRSAQPARATGTISGVVTWQYNDYVGTKGDT
jgi:hypothetical protein